MYILGISCYFHDSAAVLLKDGVLLSAIEEERFSRKKHDFEFPFNSIGFCLESNGIKGSDLDYVVFFEKPFLKFDRLLRTTLQGFPKTHRLFVQSMRTWLVDKLWIKSLICKEIGISPNNILFSEHHVSHAASAFFCSPFEESATLTFDGVGEWGTTTMGVGNGNNLSLTRELHFPHSIGLLYSAFTAFLGFEINEGEYKVMGMAPYGDPKYVDHVWEVVQQGSDGAFRLDPTYFSFHYSTTKSYTKKFIKLFGEPRNGRVNFFTKGTGYASYFGEKPNNYEELCSYNQRYADIAASIQWVTEELIVELARELYRETGSKRLCLAGGVALNSVANTRIWRDTPFEEIYIQPSAGDGGGALGAALFAWNTVLGNSDRFVMDNAYWGPSYNESEIRAALNDAHLTYRYIDDEVKLTQLTVDRIISGKVIGLFQGRSEWGPRALGNRSILADPRNPDMKDLVNSKIKFREPFRPFAPAVTVNRCSDYFDLPNPDTNWPGRFMLMVVPVSDGKQEVIPAVSHLGTARVQTVHQEPSPFYYNLIDTFGEATGVPVLLNTSFNVAGEPMVNSPMDAIKTFLDSGIDNLVIGNFLLDK